MNELSNTWALVIVFLVFLAFLVFNILFDRLIDWLLAAQKRRRARKQEQELEWERVQSLIRKVDQWKAEGYKLTPEQSELVEHFRIATTARGRNHRL